VIKPTGAGCHLNVVSYNIHGCVGSDDRQDVGRIASILRELDADLIGLQEVYNQPELADVAQLDSLAQTLGMEAISGPTLQRGGGEYGNALLTRWPVLETRRIDLSFPEREPRGALDVDVEAKGRRLRVIVTHLGLRPAERRFQVRRLVQAVDITETSQLVLLGDFNEWFPPGRPSRWLHRHFGRCPAPPTFPASFPLLSLDRIIVHPPESLTEIRTIRSPQARIASDHLPLMAVISLRP
jgi:endonuclease/exonuclease/phosphatase family metal-dependent hydrolase